MQTTSFSLESCMVVRTVLLITGVGLWNTWNSKTRENYGVLWGLVNEGSWTLGRTQSQVGHWSSYFLSRTRHWERQRWRETHLLMLRAADRQAICHPLPQLSEALTSLSAPDPAEMSAHPQQPQLCLFPIRQRLQDMHTHTTSVLWSLIVFPWVSSNVPAKCESRAMIS